MKLPFFLARRFVAGETLEEALPTVRELNDDGLHVALDKLGEHVHDREVATAARDEYIRLVRTLADESGAGPDGRPLRNRISIKLSMMGQLIDEDFCLDNLRRLLEVAAEHDVFVRLDMESSDLVESTLDLFEAVYDDFPDHVGPVLQAMLHRTDRDIDRMCELGASVRLCKGAYAEPAAIAYQDMEQIRARYLDYMERLLRHTDYSGIATHDDRIIDATKAFADRHDIGADAFEFQMLYGLRRETQREMARDYNMMVYVPYGTEWFPYFSRRLREKKENVWFVLKALFKS
jgi:proline dehydrogenase